MNKFATQLNYDAYPVCCWKQSFKIS